MTFLFLQGNVINVHWGCKKIPMSTLKQGTFWLGVQHHNHMSNLPPNISQRLRMTMTKTETSWRCWRNHIVREKKSWFNQERWRHRVKPVSTRQNKRHNATLYAKMSWIAPVTSSVLKRAQGRGLEGGEARTAGRRSRLEKESVC